MSILSKKTKEVKEFYSVEEIRNCERNSLGWFVLPNGNGVELGNGVKLGYGVKLGNGVKLGDGVKIGDKKTSLDLVKEFIASQPKEVIMWKWVDKNRMSPGWRNNEKVLYKKGSIVKEDGEVSDQQCGKGLHIFRPGYLPEYDGYSSQDNNGDKYICLRVLVKKEDILFAGLPGWDAKWRVKKLKVLD